MRALTLIREDRPGSPRIGTGSRLARLLAQSMEAGSQPVNAHVRAAPTWYRLLLAPEDFGELQAPAFLEEQMGRFLTWLAVQHGLLRVGPMSVTVRACSDVARGSPAIECGFGLGEERTAAIAALED